MSRETARNYILEQRNQFGWRPHLIQNVAVYLLTTEGFFSPDSEDRVVDNPELAYVVWSENGTRTIDVSTDGVLKLDRDLKFKIDVQVGEVDVPVFTHGPHGIGASYENIAGGSVKTEKYQSFFMTPLTMTIVGTGRRPVLALGGEILVQFLMNIRSIEDYHGFYRFRPVKLGGVQQMKEKEYEGQWATQLALEVISDITYTFTSAQPAETTTT